MWCTHDNTFYSFDPETLPFSEEVRCNDFPSQSYTSPKTDLPGPEEKWTKGTGWKWESVHVRERSVPRGLII